MLLYRGEPMDIYEYWDRRRHEKEYELASMLETLNEIGEALKRYKEERMMEFFERGETR